MKKKERGGATPADDTRKGDPAGTQHQEWRRMMGATHAAMDAGDFGDIHGPAAPAPGPPQVNNGVSERAAKNENAPAF